jgi:predicted dehydrogenase
MSQTEAAGSRNRPWRYALIGCGDIGVVRAGALARTASKLVAVSDVDAEKANGFAKRFGAEAFTDWHAMLDRDIDAVIVSTPPVLHAGMCIEAVRKGKHVLCEKPLARSVDECRAMIDAAATAGRVLATGFNYRFYPSFLQAKTLLDSGAIGSLSHVRAYAGYSATGHGQAWVKDAGVVGGGALHDNGIHMIDLTRSFLGDPVEVTGFATGHVWQYGEAEDNGFLLMRTAGNKVATLHASWTEWGKYRFRIELIGTLGSITATCFPMTTELIASGTVGGRTRRRKWSFLSTTINEHLHSYRWVVEQSFIREFEAFEQAMAGRPSAIATGYDGLRAVEIATTASHLDATGPGNPAPGVTRGPGDVRTGHEPDNASMTASRERHDAEADRGTGDGAASASMDASFSRPLSVSVIMFSGPAELDACLDSLHHQTGSIVPEIIVPIDDATAGLDPLRERYPAVTFLRLPGRCTPAELRTAAVQRSTGRIIALLEDHCVPDADWCARIVAAHDAPYEGIGGSVEKGFPPGESGDTALNWAIYMTDYSRYMNPMPAGNATSLTDCNVSYKRASLDRIADLWAREFHENVVNERFRQTGQGLWFDPSIIVREHRPMTLSTAMRDRFSFGRLFGSTRVESAPLSKRLIYAAASVVMPPILAHRAAGNLRSRNRHREQILRCAPALLFVSSLWMLGEMVGYLTRSPGSLRPASRANVVTAPAPLPE